MKVPPKRKGNTTTGNGEYVPIALNESPSEKEGKYHDPTPEQRTRAALNESPSEKEGKFVGFGLSGLISPPSMKVPPKRKGNLILAGRLVHSLLPLNESPSEKEGKFCNRSLVSSTPGLIPQ